jgi:hypothetical protein
VTTRPFSPLAISLLALAAVSAQAGTVSPASYDSINGFGQASGGLFNYWDAAYNGTGQTTTDGAALTGGLGDLADGVVPTQAWDQVESAAGNGPYVGWKELDPTITFHFASPVSLDAITVYADNANGDGGVAAPKGITVDGTFYAFATPEVKGPVALTTSGLSFTGQDLTVTVNRNAYWTFVSEVAFSGSAVPEPSTVALQALGLGLVACAIRRRQRSR